ncbi:unnamed protein product [Dracunculus medinensis]|uniref:50S ribosomal protein L19e n=1 Tax=Dracunculus medinensis TaxID=318479 RepID=A0A0N4UFP9_DRAME|nr:unnamed protein product [Dracunculus medinensis]
MGKIIFLLNDGVIDEVFFILKAPIKEIPSKSILEIHASPRLLRIRKRKMLKHKRRKRAKRDANKYAVYHREKKARIFQIIYSSLLFFRAKQELPSQINESGRKFYPHWSTVVSLEELYGLPKGDYIDKRFGLASNEDVETIEKLKDKYKQLYSKFDSNGDKSSNPS